MSDKKGLFSDRNMFIVLAILFVVLGVGYFLSLGPIKQPEIDIDVTEVEKAYNAVESAEADEAANAEANVEDADMTGNAVATATITNTADVPFDMALAKV